MRAILLSLALATAVEASAQMNYGEGAIKTDGRPMTLISSDGPFEIGSKPVQMFNEQNWQVSVQRDGGRSGRWFLIELKQKGKVDQSIKLWALEAYVRRDGNHFSIPGDRMEPAQYFDISGDLTTEKTGQDVSEKPNHCTFLPTAERIFFGYKYSCDGVTVDKRQLCSGINRLRTETASFQNQISLSFKRRHAEGSEVTLATKPVQYNQVLSRTETECESKFAGRRDVKKQMTAATTPAAR